MISRVHNNEFSYFSNFRPISALSEKKGMSPEIIRIPLIDALVMGLWNGHAILMIIGRCKNLWAKICEKIVKKSEIFTKKLL